MTVQELIRKSRESHAKRTPEERLALLQRANILDENGYYKEGYFSAETIEMSKRAKQNAPS